MDAPAATTSSARPVPELLGVPVRSTRSPTDERSHVTEHAREGRRPGPEQVPPAQPTRAADPLPRVGSARSRPASHVESPRGDPRSERSATSLEWDDRVVRSTGIRRPAAPVATSHGIAETPARSKAAADARPESDPTRSQPSARALSTEAERALNGGAPPQLVAQRPTIADSGPSDGRGAVAGAVVGSDRPDLRAARRAERQDAVEMNANRMTLRSGLHAEAILPDVGRVEIHAHTRAGRLEVELTTGSRAFADDFSGRHSELRDDLQRAHVDVGRVWVTVEAPRPLDATEVRDVGIRAPSGGATGGDGAPDRSSAQAGAGGFDGESSARRRGRSLEKAASDGDSTAAEPWRRRRVRIVL